MMTARPSAPVAPALPRQHDPAAGEDATAASHAHRPAAEPWTRASERPSASPYVVQHVVSMLLLGEERSKAVIQTLVAAGSSATLAEAFRARPSVIDEGMLQALAAARDVATFKVGLRLRPDLATPALASRLGEHQISAVFRDTLARVLTQTPRAAGPGRPR